LKVNRVFDEIAILGYRKAVMTPTVVFWPVDVRHDGVCYGWSQPMLCVAGVLQGKSVSVGIPRFLCRAQREAVIRSAGFIACCRIITEMAAIQETVRNEPGRTWNLYV
jgi:hypothetical protein